MPERLGAVFHGKDADEKVEGREGNNVTKCGTRAAFFTFCEFFLFMERGFNTERGGGCLGKISSSLHI
jgi:hypothetical protein